MNHETIQPSIEEKLGLRFVPPDQKRLTELFDQVSRQLANAGASLGMPTIPERGFLAQSLTPNQKREIDQVVGPRYAREAVELQDKFLSVPLNASSEPLISLQSLLARSGIEASFSSQPFPDVGGEFGNTERLFWIRSSMGEKLIPWLRSLQTVGITVHFADAFRPVDIQERLFGRRLKRVIKENPQWDIVADWDNIWFEARSKTAFSALLAGHTAGAALDLFLCKDGQELPLGNTYGEGGASTAVQFPFITQEEWSTRMLFQLSAEAFGFAVYPFENWHISDGDVSRSIMSTQTIEPSFVARFGPVKNFDRETGKVILFPPAEISTPFYSQARILREINIR